MKGNHDLSDIGLCFPPVCVCFKCHEVTGDKLIDNIRTAADGLIRGNLGSRDNREGHFIKESVILPWILVG